MDVNNFEGIKISIASPEKIRAWSYGEVKKKDSLGLIPEPEVEEVVEQNEFDENDFDEEMPSDEELMALENGYEGSEQ